MYVEGEKNKKEKTTSGDMKPGNGKLTLFTYKESEREMKTREALKGPY